MKYALISEEQIKRVQDALAALDKVNQQLLEALKAMVKDFDGCYAEGEPAMIKARAAIAKATGESK